MDPIIIEKISAMKKYSNSRKQQLVVLPTLTLYLVAASILCLLLTSPAWFPRLCSLLTFFLLTTLPDLATTFLLSPKCLFVVGNLIVAFLVGESRLSNMVNEINEQHMKRNMVTIPKETAAAMVVADDSPVVGAVEGEEVKEEEAEEEELHQRVEDFIARVKKQRKLEAKSFFDADR
ncbi:hypothetical protein PR202_ga08452 [Eleusine coracana subsp. coracana]|uniref:DUF4408 domain-containing protein n=1 Tax=Eleusine coracana subsp. coracana TaxID=191504 RepID=A0AAV5C019_ELECO|nr:hypothetical protein QOZ80_1AG0044870 [Eleusine coracana subsp. coracana]GJM92026.1 hypothetical protein PR202_ga08452 [Eleusine coracana subsp. coracana]